MHKNRGIAEEWDDATDSWVDFVRQGKDYYRDELNNPATFKLLGNLRGRLVLDLACGEGYNTRILARKGAKVTGVDFSQKMIELAKQAEVKKELGINYVCSDAADLHQLSGNYFDIVTCFMSLQDIEDYERAISEVARVLKHKGRFVFSIPHPCFELIVENGNRISATSKYYGKARHPLEWKMERLKKPFKTTSFHRTLTNYSRTLFNNKLLISRIVEPRPTQRGLKKHPPLKEVLLRPQSIVVESMKIGVRDLNENSCIRT